jgi:type I restriction enzyme S subunit
MTRLETKSLDDVSDKTNRFAIVDGPFGTQLRADEYVPEGVPLVRVTNLSFDGRFNADDLVFITEQKAKTLKRSELRKDDIIIAKTGATIGKSALFPFTRGVIASSCLKATVDKTQVDPTYILYRIASPEGQSRILDGAGGSTRTTINITPFKQITFAFPPKAHQSKIAELLCTVESAIEQTEALISKHQRIQTGLMQDLLTRGIDEHGRVRDPVCHPEQFRDSLLGRIPVEWEVELLGDRLIKNAGFLQTGPFGSQLHAHEYTPEGVPVMMPQDIREGGFAVENIARIPQARAHDLKRHRMRLNDLVFARRGDLSRCAVITPFEVGWLCGTGCLLMRFQQHTLSPAWLSLIYRHSVCQRQIAAQAVGTTMVNLNTPLLESLRLAFPPKEEQDEIVRLLKAVDEDLKTTSYQLGKVRRLKAGLMQDLLTGKVSVEPLLETHTVS